MANPRLYVKFDFQDKKVNGPFQLTKLANVFNYKPHSEDYEEGGQRHLLQKIEYVICNVIPRSLFTTEQRRKFVELLQPNHFPPEICLRSERGDIYSFSTLPSYFGECLDEDDKCKRITFQLCFKFLDQMTTASEEELFSDDSTTSSRKNGKKLEPQLDMVSCNDENLTKNDANKNYKKEQVLVDSQNDKGGALIKKENISPSSLADRKPHQEQLITPENCDSKNDSEPGYINELKVGSFHYGTAIELTSEGLLFDIGGVVALCPMKWAKNILPALNENQPYISNLLIWSINNEDKKFCVTCHVPQFSIQAMKKDDLYEGTISYIQDQFVYIDINCGCYAILNRDSIVLNDRCYVSKIGDKVRVKIASVIIKNDMSDSKVYVTLEDVIRSVDEQGKQKNLSEQETKYVGVKQENGNVKVETKRKPLSYDTESLTHGLVKDITRQNVIIDVNSKYDAILQHHTIKQGNPSYYNMIMSLRIGDRVTVALKKVFLMRKQNFYSCLLVSRSKIRGVGQFRDAKKEFLTRN